MTDPHALARFVDAQAPVMDDVLTELRAGAKRTHWMWFIFPQLAALGRSQAARYYGLASREEALAYWRHALLGPRLVLCAGLLQPHAARGAVAVLGPIDALKLRSCLTLFEQVAPEEPTFAWLLAAHYGGQRDERTLALLVHG